MSKTKTTKVATVKTPTKNLGKIQLTSPAKIKGDDTLKVASKTGFSLSYISNVKAGRRYNAEIVNAFNGLTARRK